MTPKAKDLLPSLALDDDRRRRFTEEWGFMWDERPNRSEWVKLSLSQNIQGIRWSLRG